MPSSTSGPARSLSVGDECPACGQKIAEPATAEYVAGLLAPSVLVATGAILSHEFGHISHRTFWVSAGALLMGTVILVMTDPHVEERWSRW